jgi:hypothetical protein
MIDQFAPAQTWDPLAVVAAIAAWSASASALLPLGDEVAS